MRTTSRYKQEPDFRNMAFTEEVLKARKSALKAQDLAELFGVTQQHIYKLASSGAMPCFRLGSAVRFDPVAIAEWLRQNRLPAL